MVSRRVIGFGPQKSRPLATDSRSGIDFSTAEYILLSNYGFQGSVIYSSQEDYDRFEAYLYLLNAVESMRASNFFLGGREREIFTAARGDNLIAIGAYSITPKEFLILATPLTPHGIAKFMQKIQTAYTMYFNLKYQRSGRLFHSSYRAERAHDDVELKYFLGRTHISPVALFDPFWEEASDLALRSLALKAAKYRYSSIGEYAEKNFRITNPHYFPKFFERAHNPDVLLRFWIQYKKKQLSNRPGHGI